MARVKGTILLDFVKTIRADKKGSYDQYLTAKDREIISERILPSAWYPYETYMACFQGVAAVVGKNNSQTIRQWGRLYGEAIITGVYKGIVKEGAPLDSLKKYSSYYRNLFDFGEFEIVPASPREAVLAVRGFDLQFEPQYHLIRGWIERSIELCGAREVKSDFVAKSWEGAPDTRLQLSWSP